MSSVIGMHGPAGIPVGRVRGRRSRPDPDGTIPRLTC